MADGSFSATASLLHNNLAISNSGWIASVHNSVNVGTGKLMMHSTVSGQTKDGPEANQITSIRYLELANGTVLCVSSTNGTQIFNEEASALLFFAPINNDPAETLDVQRCHQAACVVPGLQHIAIGTSKGSLVLVHAAAADTFLVMPECLPGSATTEISDLCFSAATQTVFSAHGNGEIRLWVPAPQGYTNADGMVGNGQAPVRILPMGTRLLVAYGPGTICLYDALSRELQVEVTAHARWITAVTAKEEYGQVASVGEDTVLNVWNVDPGTGRVLLQHSSIVVDKLLTGVAIGGAGVHVVAYDSEEIYKVALGAEAAA